MKVLPETPMPKTEKPPRLGDDETAYHTSLVEQVKEAQEAQGRITQTQSAWSNWAGYLKQKYGLSDGDSINEDGTIVYGNVPAV
jgi:hypothetical protein